MTFSEFILESENATHYFEDRYNKISAFVEAANQEYLVNHKEAELKVISESGTLDDLLYLEEANEKGVFEKLANALKKLAQEFRDWMNKLIDGMKSFFATKETKDALEAAEEAVKNNPELKNKTIEVTDIEELEKIFEESNDKIDKRVSLIRAGKSSPDEKNIRNEIDDTFGKKASKLSTATKAITITAALALATGLVAKMIKHRDMVSGSMDQDFDPLTAQPEDMADVVGYQQLRARLAREYAIENNKFLKNVRQFFIRLKKGELKGGYVDLKHLKELDNMSDKEVTDYLNKQTEEWNQKVKDHPGENPYGTWHNPNAKDTDYTRKYVKFNKKTNTFDEISDEEYEKSKKKKAKKEAKKNKNVNEGVETVDLDNEIFNEESYLNNLMTEMAELNAETNLTAQESTEESTDMADYINALEAEIIEEAKENKEMTAEMTAEEYLEAMEEEIFGSDEQVQESEDSEEQVQESEGMTAEEYLDALESEVLASLENDEEPVQESEEELFGNDDAEEVEESEGMTAEEYLEAMENEIFG